MVVQIACHEFIQKMVARLFLWIARLSLGVARSSLGMTRRLLGNLYLWHVWSDQRTCHGSERLLFSTQVSLSNLPDPAVPLHTPVFLWMWLDCVLLSFSSVCKHLCWQLCFRCRHSFPESPCVSACDVIPSRHCL